MLLECFVYTNGRSTYDCCISYLKKSIQKAYSAQVEFPKQIKVFRDVKLIDAMNHTLSICQGTHFMKVDDDFVLHPSAIFHMLKCLCTPIDQNIAMYNWHLWEVWTNRIVSGIKIYSVEALKSIGGFAVDKYAKVDKITHTRLREAGFKLQKDASVIGLHTCGTWEEQRQYEKLWNIAAEVEYKKSTHNEQKQYNVPILEQVKYIDTGFLERLNQKNNTKFYDWSGRKKRTLLKKRAKAKALKKRAKVVADTSEKITKISGNSRLKSRRPTRIRRRFH